MKHVKLVSLVAALVLAGSGISGCAAEPTPQNTVTVREKLVTVTEKVGRTTAQKTDAEVEESTERETTEEETTEEESTEEETTEEETPEEETTEEETTEEETTEEEPVDEPAADTVVMPDVVCQNLQDAQNEIQRAGVFYSRSVDASGEGRNQMVDSSWMVVAQRPAAGTVIGEGEALLSVVKYGEPNEC